MGLVCTPVTLARMQVRLKRLRAGWRLTGWKPYEADRAANLVGECIPAAADDPQGTMRKSHRPFAAKRGRLKQGVSQRQINKIGWLKVPKLPVGYPRRVIRLDLWMLREHPAVVCARATHDLVVVLRCGKPAFVVVHCAYATEFLNIRRIMNKPASEAGGTAQPDVDQS